MCEGGTARVRPTPGWKLSTGSATCDAIELKQVVERFFYFLTLEQYSQKQVMTKHLLKGSSYLHVNISDFDPVQLR